GANLIISAAGKLTHAEFLAMVQPLVENVPDGEKLTCPKVPDSMKESGPRRCEEIRDHIEQAHICIGFHTLGRHAPERHGLKILNVLLGENMSSRLFQVLREENGLCYSVFSDSMNLEDTGLLSISTGLDLENVPKALNLIANCLHEFQAKEVTPERLDQAITYTIGQGRMALESTVNQMMWCGESVLAYNRIIEPAESFAKLQNVTAAEVQDLARKTFRSPTTAIAYIGADVPDLALNAFLT
ncbi:MAG: insulinase family protein, partial [Verrucomicrobiota bacterium]